MKVKPILIQKACAADAEEILKLQKAAYISEAEIYNDFSIPPLTQTLPEILDDFDNYIILKAITSEVIVGSVRGQINEDGSVYIGRLMAHPDFQNNGLGTRLMQAIEAEFPQAQRFWLTTGHRSERNLHLYNKLGYSDFKTERVNDTTSLIYLEKITIR